MVIFDTLAAAPRLFDFRWDTYLQNSPMMIWGSQTGCTFEGLWFHLATSSFGYRARVSLPTASGSAHCGRLWWLGSF